MVAALAFTLLATAAGHQQPITLTGHVVEAETGDPVASADVIIRPADRSTQTDREGRFSVELPGPGRITVHVSRIGYEPRDTSLSVRGDTSLVVELDTHPVDIDPVEARVIRPPFARSGRELFEAEVQPGLVGVSRTQIAEMPSIGEVDVLRALQALPGVIAVNDLASTLHVMGGGPGQNLFLWDGARVYAPYHMFGMLGAFPTRPIDGIEFYRGAIPSRYGDALSAVVDIKQGGRAEDYFGDVSLSTVAAGATVGGPLAGAGQWMIGARRTHFDRLLSQLAGDREFPYAFHDAHGQVSWAPTPAHQIQVSGLVTGDRFAAPANQQDVYGLFELRTRWSNQVFSGSWQWAGESWSTRLAATWSGYHGVLETGDPRGDHITSDHLGIATLNLEVQRRVGKHAVHLGVGGEGGRVNLIGSQGGGYVDGGRDGAVAVVSGFAEADLELGRLRVVPGLRIDADAPGRRLLIQPRASGRVEVTQDLSITVGAGRTAQRLHAVRDARTVLPGAPLWVAPTADEPVATSDALTAEITWWADETWSIDGGGYLRRLRDIPMWFPEGSRELAAFRFDRGRAAGLEVLVRRHGEGVTGWVAYGLSAVEHENAETGGTYNPPWDRRHSVDAAAFVPLPWRLRATARVMFGTGTPFWPFAGFQAVPRLTTLSGRLFWDMTSLAPYWSQEQMRMPQHFRLDLGLRGELDLFGARFEPHAGILNATARPNVLYYRPFVEPDGSGLYLIPETSSPTNWIVSLGLNVSF